MAKSKLILRRACSKYGAEMGRRSIYPDDADAPIKLHLECLRWYDGDYDKAGAYWGSGKHVFCAFTEDNSVQIFKRAGTRAGAKELIRSDLPNARFYR